jgi:Fe2+ or Zn2+ uptake regulation protein
VHGTDKSPREESVMAKETTSQSQQDNAVSASTNEKTVAAKEEPHGKVKKVQKKEEQQFKDEFEENNKKEKRMEEEKELQDIANCKEVMDALFGVREAAEKAVCHMNGVPADGEDIEDMFLKQTEVKSAQDFLYYMSLVGMKEAKKKKKKEAHKSPYKDFIQLNNRTVGSLIDLVDKNPQAMKVLLFIIQNMDGYNALVCSYAVLQERFGISHATVWRHIKYLKEHGYIYAQKTGSSNVYILSPELAWKSWGANLKYCKFPTNVILSYNEQEEQDSKKNIKKKTGKLELKEPVDKFEIE